MKKRLIIGLSMLLILIFAFSYLELTGKVIQGPPEGEDMMGPGAERMACMQECTTRGCDVNDMECRTAKSNACGQECGVDISGPPAPADKGEACMQECTMKGCDEFDFQCQRINKETCEEKCNMKGDAPDESEMSEEQLCIAQCVAKTDSSIICRNSQEGETGNEICKRCADECVYLYAGPCLNNEEKTAKEKECETCEHCYGEPVMGASGEGWDCIVDVECKDATSEFGDEPGEGPGIGQEGYVAPNPIAKAVDGVIKFFKGIFNGNNEN